MFFVTIESVFWALAILFLFDFFRWTLVGDGREKAKPDNKDNCADRRSDKT